MSRNGRRTSMTVLLSLSPPDGTTRYVDQVVSSTPDTEFLYFRWRTALVGRYDILHVHWPELMIRSGAPAKAWMRRRALDLLLLRARVTRKPVIRTVHNERPHEAGSTAEQRSLDRFDDATTLAIVMNGSTGVAVGTPTFHIPHGHYRDRLHPAAQVEAVAGRLLYFGLIRPYKGVEHLITAFSALVEPELELRVVGRPQSRLRGTVEHLVATSDRVSGRLEFVSDSDLADEVAACSLVVLPYREMHNSGALLVALSLDRPVLVPDTPSTRELANEVGTDWVRRYEGTLTTEVLRDAVTWSTSVDRRGRPDLDGRDHDAVGGLHARAYAHALRDRRPSTVLSRR